MKLFKFDASEIAAVSDAGLGKLLSDGNAWEPSEGSRALALEVLADERAIELSEAEAGKLLSARGAEKPSFSAND